MNILIVCSGYPMPDRNAGDLRLLEVMTILACKHPVTFCATAPANQAALIPGDAIQKYKDNLQRADVKVSSQPILECLAAARFDTIFFEFFHAASNYLAFARYYQPWATMVVDTVDVCFDRLIAKAALTQDPQHVAHAEEIKQTELDAYAKADVLITVSDSDSEKIRSNGVATPICIIPTVHRPLPTIPFDSRSRKHLLFVGGFTHEPNEDAVLYFCAEILPLIRRQVPDVVFTVVGNAPPARIRELQGPSVEILGYVPDLTGVLGKSGISVAPLRFGSGIKGKIGEALAAGLPVVTTSVGAEGFGLTDGVNVLIGDDAEGFANHVVSLIVDESLHRSIRNAGHSFINAHFGIEAIERLVARMIELIESTRIRKPSAIQKLRALGAIVHWRYTKFLQRHILWRFQTR